jgi:hypothetical protein
MNTQGATTEPFYLFLRAHEDIAANIKLSYGALHALTQDENPTRPDKRNALTTLPTGGEPWGKSTYWRDVKRRIPLARRFISHMGLVLVASAFEDFVTNIISEYSRYSDFSGKGATAKGPSAEDVGGDSLRTLYTSLQWDIKPIKYLLPLYDYLILVRNCIVHRSGRATQGLIEKAESKQLQQCIETWSSNRKAPQLPEVLKGHDIPLLPRHAILFGQVCHRAAVDINSRLSDFLGVEGTVYMAAYHGLLADDRVRIDARRSPEQIINLMLTERFHVPILDKYEVIGILKRLNKWKQCRDRYIRLYPDVKYS